MVKRLARLAAAVLLVSVAAGCRSESRIDLNDPAQVVEGLLTARLEGVRERAVYRRYVESTAVADSLVADAESRPATGPAAVPEWTKPLSAIEESSTARVEVRWNRTREFVSWPEITTFLLVRTRGGTWLVYDALEGRVDRTPTRTPTPSGE